METPSMDSMKTLLVLHHYYTRQDSSSAAFILDSALEVAQVCPAQLHPRCLL